MAGGFTPAAGTNYTNGNEAILARRLDRMAKALNINLTGISGYRTPAHSVAVGGFANDPHTQGAASDTNGAESIPESTLNRFGLTRPFTGAGEANHIQLLGAPSTKKGGGGVLGAVGGAAGDVVGAVGSAGSAVGGAASDVAGAVGGTVNAITDIPGAIASIPGKILDAFVNLVQTWGLRLLQIVVGAAGIVFSLALLAKAAGAGSSSGGGTKIVPVPV